MAFFQLPMLCPAVHQAQMDTDTNYNTDPATFLMDY